MDRPKIKCEINGGGTFTVYDEKGLPIAECSDPMRPFDRSAWGFKPDLSMANQSRIMKLYVDMLNLQGYLGR